MIQLSLKDNDMPVGDFKQGETRLDFHLKGLFRASLVAQWKNNPPANAGDAGLIPGLGRIPGEGNGNSLQYSCLKKKNPMDRGAWQATVHGITKTWTLLSD